MTARSVALILVLAFFTLETCMMNTVEKKKTPVLSHYKLAMIQMDVRGGDQQGNLSRASDRIREAAGHGAKLALLPEVLDFGWCHTSARQHAGPIPGGMSFMALSKAARENAIYVCAGIAEQDGDQIFNSAVIIDSRGRLLIRHRKINELDFARDLYDQGDRLNVVHTELGTLGLLICADANADNLILSRSLGAMGANIILSPCAWAVPPDYDNTAKPYGGTWRDAYRPVSEAYKTWFIGVSNVGKVEDGEWKGWDCIGCSLAYAPGGKEVVQGPYGEKADTILYVEVDLADHPWTTKK